ncbi:hypothetical protein Gasu2_32150 [Galdieria sulphuraria]|nr:hypothetical protein Gasu2_32150 [Galdieria sulphuraria]
MSSYSHESLSTSNKARHRTMMDDYSQNDNNCSSTPASLATYQTYYPNFENSQPLMYLPVTIEEGVLRPFTGEVGGVQMPSYNGFPLVWGIRYNSDGSNINSHDRSNYHTPVESFVPAHMTNTTRRTTYHHFPTTGQIPLGWLPQQFSRNSYTQAATYGRQTGRRMKPRNRFQGTSVGWKEGEVSFEQMDSCDSTVIELRRVLSTHEQNTLSFFGSEIDKRRVHRFLVEDHILKNALVQHLRQSEGLKHSCDEILLAIFALFFSSIDAKPLVDECMNFLNKVSRGSGMQALLVEKLDLYVSCLYDHVERVKRILSNNLLEKKRSSFIEKSSNPLKAQLSSFQYFQGKTLSFFYCRQELYHIQKNLVELKESLRYFKNEVLSRNVKDSLIETQRMKVFLESFHSKLEQEVSLNLLSECESKLNVYIRELFKAAHTIFTHLKALVNSDWEYLRDCKDNFQRQASKLESFSQLSKRYAAAKEVAKEVSRLIETKEHRCQKILEERVRIKELNTSLAKILKIYGRENLTRELLRETSSLLKVQRSIDIGLEQLFSISFGEVLDLIRMCLEDSGKRSNRKFARFSLNLPASVVIVEPTVTPKSGVSLDIVSPRQRHHRMKSNPDALLHVDRLSPSPGCNQIDKANPTPDTDSISFSQVSNNSMRSFEEENVPLMKNQHDSSCYGEQVDDEHFSQFSTPKKETSKGLEYAIRTLNLRRVEGHETASTANSSGCYYDGTFRKCHSTASTPRREDSKDLSMLKKTKTTTVASPKIHVQPTTIPFHHRSQRSQSFDDIIVL